MKFKVGDRVATYHAGDRYVGAIKEIEPNYGGGGSTALWVEAKSASGSEYTIWAHPKQCRRLVKKPRRRVWVHMEATPFIPNHPVGANCRFCVEFVEVKKK